MTLKQEIKQSDIQEARMSAVRLFFMLLSLSGKMRRKALFPRPTVLKEVLSLQNIEVLGDICDNPNQIVELQKTQLENIVKRPSRCRSGHQIGLWDLKNAFFYLGGEHMLWK